MIALHYIALGAAFVATLVGVVGAALALLMAWMAWSVPVASSRRLALGLALVGVVALGLPVTTLLWASDGWRLGLALASVAINAVLVWSAGGMAHGIAAP